MEIYADNVRIPFNEAISVKLFNPLFNDISGHSLPVNFNGRIPYVSRAFGFPGKKEAEIKDSINGRIKAPFVDLTGSWKVTRATDSIIEAYFKSSAGDFYSLIKDKYLHEIDFGDIHDLPADLQDPNCSLFDTYYPLTEYAMFSAYMPNGKGDNNTELGNCWVNQVTVDDNGDPYFNPYPLSSANLGIYLFVATIIQYMFAEFGYKVESSIFTTDPDLCRLVVFNTYNNIASIYSDEYTNNYLKVNYSKLVPHITCGDFIKALRDRFNIGFFINEQSKSVEIKSFNQVIESGSTASVTKSGKPSVEDTRFAGMRFPVVFADEYATHGITSEDELNNVIEVNKYRDILPLTRNDGDLIFVKSERNYYRINADLEAVKLCTDDIQYSEGNASEEITQLSSIPAMYTYTWTHQYTYLVEGEPTNGETEADYLLPRCDLAGNRAENEFIAYPLMLLFARGIAPCYVVPADGAPDYKHPIGSGDLFDAEAGALTGTMTLKWDGTYGLVEKLWLNRIAWEMNIKKLVKTEILSSDIDKIIDFSKVVRIGTDNYLVNSFTLQISEKQVRVEELELLRL